MKPADNPLYTASQIQQRVAELAAQLSAFPRACMREDRLSSYEQWGMGLTQAIGNEFEHGQRALADPDFIANVQRFFAGRGAGSD